LEVEGRGKGGPQPIPETTSGTGTRLGVSGKELSARNRPEDTVERRSYSLVSGRTKIHKGVEIVEVSSGGEPVRATSGRQGRRKKEGRKPGKQTGEPPSILAISQDAKRKRERGRRKRKAQKARKRKEAEEKDREIRILREKVKGEEGKRSVGDEDPVRSMRDTTEVLRVEPEPEASLSPASPPAAPLRNAYEDHVFFQKMWEEEKEKKGTERWQKMLRKYPPVVRRMIADFRRIRDADGSDMRMRKQMMFEQRIAVAAESLRGREQKELAVIRGFRAWEKLLRGMGSYEPFFGPFQILGATEQHADWMGAATMIVLPQREGSIRVLPEEDKGLADREWTDLPAGLVWMVPVWTETQQAYFEHRAPWWHSGRAVRWVPLLVAPWNYISEVFDLVMQMMGQPRRCGAKEVLKGGGACGGKNVWITSVLGFTEGDPDDIPT
jgi:hypothetical protein